MYTVEEIKDLVQQSFIEHFVQSTCQALMRRYSDEQNKISALTWKPARLRIVQDRREASTRARAFEGRLLGRGAAPPGGPYGDRRQGPGQEFTHPHKPPTAGHTPIL